MTLKDARQVRDLFRKYGIYCTVPLGWGPDKYVARIIHSDTLQTDFKSMQEARDYLARSIKKRRKFWREYNKPRRDTRSSIERMIDRACGLE